jgi:hypothetical protein
VFRVTGIKTRTRWPFPTDRRVQLEVLEDVTAPYVRHAWDWLGAYHAKRHQVEFTAGQLLELRVQARETPLSVGQVVPVSKINEFRRWPDVLKNLVVQEIRAQGGFA